MASLPAALRYGVPLLVLAFLVHRVWPRWIAVRVVGFLETTAQLEGVAVEVFPFDDSGAGAYPPSAAASAVVDGDGDLSLWTSDVPAAGVYLRADSPVHGIATLHVAPHRPQVQLELGVPRRLLGRVVDSSGKSLAAARVVALPHRYGPVLAEAATDADGEFAIDRLSSSASFFALRVLLAGYVALEVDVQWVEGSPLSLTLYRTRPVEGRVAVPVGIDASTLSLRALRFPGATGMVRADGGFTLEALPMPPTRVRLLVAGLPAGFTHHAVYVSAGDKEVEVNVQRAAVMRGVVVTADRDLPIVAAYVEHPHGPRGGAGAYTDSSGRFVLVDVPAGRVRVEAFGGHTARGQPTVAPDGAHVPTGFADTDVEAGKDVEGVVVRVH